MTGSAGGARRLAGSPAAAAHHHLSRSTPVNRPPLPPFAAEAAAEKARLAEDAWNTRNPVRVALAYTTDSRWRNRAEFH